MRLTSDPKGAISAPQRIEDAAVHVDALGNGLPKPGLGLWFFHRSSGGLAALSSSATRGSATQEVTPAEVASGCCEGDRLGPWWYRP